MASGSTLSEEGSTESSEEEDEEESGSKVRLAHPIAAKLQYIAQGSLLKNGGIY